MRPVGIAPLDRFVRDEPGVAPAPHPSCSRAPAADVRLVLIWDPECESIQPGQSLRCEVKDELVAVVDEPIAVDWFVMADRQIAGEPRGGTRRIPIDRDRLDPMDDV